VLEEGAVPGDDNCMRSSSRIIYIGRYSGRQGPPLLEPCYKKDILGGQECLPLSPHLSSYLTTCTVAARGERSDHPVSHSVTPSDDAPQTLQKLFDALEYDNHAVKIC